MTPPPRSASTRPPSGGPSATAGLRAQRRFSQNFLVDVDVLEAILAAAAPTPGRRVLEIGPGLGILTGGLLAAGARVTAVEIDRGMVAHLRGAFALELAAGALTLVEGDVLDEDLAALATPPYDVVANLPYHVTSPVLHRLLGGEAGPRPERCVLMVQREVAERIAAPPGSMSYLSVFVQYHAAPTIVRRVPRDAFEPAPEVESAVLALDVRAAGRPRAPPGRHGGRPVAPRPGGVPRAPQDAPQRAAPPAADRPGDDRGGAGRGRASRAIAARRRSGWGSGSPSWGRSARSPPDRRGRRGEGAP